MLSSLLTLPPSILSLFLRYLELDSLLKLTKLTGCKALWTQCTARGATTDIIALRESALPLATAALVQELPTFFNLTTLVIGDVLCPIFPQRTLFLPRTLQSIKFTFRNSISFFLRPVVEEDSDEVKYFASHEGFTPILLCDYLPDLRILDLHRPFFAEMRGAVIRRFLQHLPDQLRSLSLLIYAASANYNIRDLMPPSSVLQNLNKLKYLIRGVELSLDDLFGATCPIPDNIGAIDQASTSLLPSVPSEPFWESLQTLKLDDLRADSSWERLTCLRDLRTLELNIVKRQTPFTAETVEIPLSTLPPQLTDLTIQGVQRVSQLCALIQRSGRLLRRLLIDYERCSDIAHVGDQIITECAHVTYLPPTLRTLEVFSPVATYVIVLSAQLPPTLTSLSLDSRLAQPIPDLDKLTSLTFLKANMQCIGVFEDGQQTLHLPASLTSIQAICYDSYPLASILTQLPQSLRNLEGAFELSKASRFVLKGLAEWSLAAVAERTRALLIPHLPASSFRVRIYMDQKVSYWAKKHLADLVEVNTIGNFVPVKTFQILQDLPSSLLRVRSRATLHSMQPHLLPPSILSFDCSGKWDWPANLKPEIPQDHPVADPAELLLDPINHLPATLEHLTLSTPKVLKVNEERYLIWPLLETAPRLSSLALDLNPYIAPSALLTLPATLTKLVIQGDMPFYDNSWSVSELIRSRAAEQVWGTTLARHWIVWDFFPADWLPNLVHFTTRQILISLPCFIDRIHKFKTFRHSRMAILLQQVIARLPNLPLDLDEDFLARLCIQHFLPPHLRHLDDTPDAPEIKFGWDHVSLAALPQNLESLAFRNGTFLTTDDTLARLLPSTLTRFSTLGLSKRSFERLSYLPRSLRSFSAYLWEPTQIGDLPPDLTSLELDCSLTVELTPEFLNKLPRNLRVLSLSSRYRSWRLTYPSSFAALPRNLIRLRLDLAVNPTSYPALPSTLQALHLTGIYERASQALLDELILTYPNLQSVNTASAR